jgi:hypothetical protein
MAALTDDQVIAIIFFNTFSAILSIIGSSTIIYLLSKSKKSSVYNRLMLGISFFDIMSAVFLLLAPYLLPRSGGRKWANGNDQTCTMLGFFVQLGCAVPFYNMSLNTFFLLTIVFGMNESRISTCIEPSLHLISILYPLTTAFFGVGFNLYSELELGVSCWIGEFPHGCDDNPNVECTSTMIGWIYSGIPFAGSFIVLTITNLLIYRKVRLTTKQSRRYSIDSVIAHCNSIAQRYSLKTSNEIPVHSEKKVSFDVCKTKSLELGSNDGGSCVVMPEQKNDRMKKIGQKRHGGQTNQSVLTQATLYVLASFSTTLCMSILRIIESEGVKRQDESSIFWLTLLTHVTYPLQGFWNFLIYVRPRYLRWRQREPGLSRYWALKQCLNSGNAQKKVPKAETPSRPRFSASLQEASSDIQDLSCFVTV